MPPPPLAADLSAQLDALAPAPPAGQGPRLFVPASRLEADATATLDPGQVHYLRAVMRRAVGDPVVLFNGKDGEWLARLSRVAKTGAEAVCETRLRRQEDEPPPGPWLLFAPLKRGPVDMVAEKATELGASRLLPVLTQRTTAARVNAARLSAHAVEAAEQCRRLTVPEVADPIALSALGRDWPADRRLFVLAEHGAALPASAAFAQAADQPAALLVGPEGGFTELELDALRQLPFVTAVRLGPRVLRAETAALAALALWQAVAGDTRPNVPV